ALPSICKLIIGTGLRCPSVPPHIVTNLARSMRAFFFSSSFGLQIMPLLRFRSSRGFNHAAVRFSKDTIFDSKSFENFLLGEEAGNNPFLANGGATKLETVMQAGLAFLPKLDALGNDAIARPMRRAFQQRIVGVLLLQFIQRVL